MTTITRYADRGGLQDHNHSDAMSPAALARSGPIPAPRPVDRTATTRRSRLAAGQVPHLVRRVWDELTPRQRDNVIKYAETMTTWDDLTDERRDELIRARLARFAAENDGQVDDIRRRNAVTAANEAAAEARQAKRATTATPRTSLEHQAAMARMHGGWVAVCDNCGGSRPAYSARPVARFCDQCTNYRAGNPKPGRSEAA